MKPFVLSCFLAAIALASGCAPCHSRYPHGPLIGGPAYGWEGVRAGSVLSGPYRPGRLVSPQTAPAGPAEG